MSPKAAKLKPATSDHIRDVEGIAAAWGIRRYSKERMNLWRTQKTKIQEATAHPQFPKPVKTKGGMMWPRAAVMDFAMRFVDMNPGAREFVINSEFKSGKHPTSNIQHPTPNGELPAQANPAGDGELFAEVSAKEMRKARYDYLQKLFLNPEDHERKITEGEKKELRAERPYLFSNEGPTHSSENIGGGTDGVAKYINMKFPWVGVYGEMIKRWIRSKSLPAGCQKPFPPAGPGHRWKAEEIDDWVMDYIPKQALEQSLPLGMDYQSAQAKLDYERSLKENEIWEQSMSHKFMETRTVEGFVEGFGAWLAEQQDRFIEDTAGVRQLVAEAVRVVFNASAEQLAILDARLRPELVRANDAMKSACANHGEELFKQLVTDRKEAVKKAQERQT